MQVAPSGCEPAAQLPLAHKVRPSTTGRDDHTTQHIHILNHKMNSLKVFFPAIHTVLTLWRCIYHEFKDAFPCLFTLGLYNGCSMNALVLFFAALAEVQVAVVSVLNLPRHGFPASCRIGHCCACSPLLFA